MERNVINQYVPPKMYAFLVRTQERHNLSISEVMTAIMRKGMEEFLGFKCPHERVRYAKKTGLPYCFDCWTRLEQVNETIVDVKGKVRRISETRPLPSFLEEKEQTVVSSGTVQKPVPSAEKTDII